MKSLILTLLGIVFLGEFASANSLKNLPTQMEQVSAVIQGKKYSAQISRVQIPGDAGRTVVVDNIVVVAPNGVAQSSSVVSIEMRSEFNGTTYKASITEPLASEERKKAVVIAQNQVEWTRKTTSSNQASRIQSFPTYSAAVPVTVLTMDYSPMNKNVQHIIDVIKDSAMNNSKNAFDGLIQQQQLSKLDTERFAQTIQQGRNQIIQLKQQAERSGLIFHQSLNNFASEMQALQNREVANLAIQISRADPVLENILVSGETKVSADIRAATADVSPLNPKAKENLSLYGDRFSANGLLKDGVFNNSINFPATALGHRTLESANLLSDALIKDSTIAESPAGTQLAGASFTYLNASMKALNEGRMEDAERFGEQGRKIARALRGEGISKELMDSMSSGDAAALIHEQAYRETLGLRGEGRELLEDGFKRAQPLTREGQFAKSFGRSLLADSKGLSESELKQTGLMLLDVSLGMVPVVGGVKSLLYMVAGENLITGEKLTTLDYVFCAIDVLTLGSAGTLTKIVSKIPSNELLKNGLKAGSAYAKQFSNFVSGSINGLRKIEKFSPGYTVKNFVTHPGATLALGKNVNLYGADFGKELTEYAAKKSLGIVEKAHISAFGGGFTKIIVLEQASQYIEKTSMLAGKEGGRMFVVATDQFEAAAKNMRSEADVLKWLGLEGNVAKGGLARADFAYDLKLNPRLPDGTEAGVNQFFQNNGFTTGKARELVVDPISIEKVRIKQLEF